MEHLEGWRGARVLVTGGAGFVGSHVVEALVARGAEVEVLDDLSTGSEDHLAVALRTGRCRLRVASAADPRAVEPLVGDCGTVFHLAAAVGVDLVASRSRETLERNLAAARTVLAAAGRTRTPVVVASSSEVYGRSGRVPFAEDADLVLGSPVGPRWSYAAGKAAMEWLALGWAREDGLSVVVARLFNTVGPRQSGRYGMVVPIFVDQALRGEPLTVHGDGRQTRCFAHVRDVVRALLQLAREPRARGRVVNVGSPHEISIRRLAEEVRRITASDSPLRFVPAARDRAGGDVRRRVPDLSRLRDLLGWIPDTPLHRILADVVADRRRSGHLAGNRSTSAARAPGGAVTGLGREGVPPGIVNQ